MWWEGHFFSEFKERYCEEEKPQPKLHLGERVRIVSSGEEDFINMITQDDCYELLEHRGKYTESDLAPYTKPETKPTEDMETKELDLYELLKGYQGTIYSVVHDADVELKLANGYIELMGIEYYSNGSMYDVAGRCLLYPSRALYEQYPLDPYAAWMKWKEEQRTYEIKISIDYCENFMGVVDATTLTFHSPADRDKCIEEIKAIIEKYSKK